MSIERLRALEKDIRESVALADAVALGVMGINRPARWADELASLIAELGQEVGAVAPVSFAVELADGTLGALGWIDYAKFEHVKNMGTLANGARYVFAYRTSPAHTSEARDSERLDFVVNRGANIDCYKGAWTEETVYRVTAFGSILTQWHDSYREAIDAAMCQEGGE